MKHSLTHASESIFFVHKGVVDDQASDYEEESIEEFKSWIINDRRYDQVDWC